MFTPNHSEDRHSQYIDGTFCKTLLNVLELAIDLWKPMSLFYYGNK